MYKWQKVKTVGDFLNFIESPDIDYVDFTNSFANNMEQSFWVAAHITNTPNYKQLLKKKPKISSTELSSTTMTASELNYHKSNNFGNSKTNCLTKNVDNLQIVKIYGGVLLL